MMKPSPNHGERRGAGAPSMLILHYTGMKNGIVALRRLVDPRSEVSCHYLVFEDGRVVQMVPEARRAWHAGQSIWEGLEDINSHSIGIEIVNPGHTNGYCEFPLAQMKAVTLLCQDIVQRWRIEPWRVLAHSDIAPMRKMDPGEYFSWQCLAESGVGLWVPPAPLVAGPVLSLNDRGALVQSLQTMLAFYGYGIPVNGHYDMRTEAVVQAFQRHFRQNQVDGLADGSTIQTLRDLVGLKSKAGEKPST